MCTDKGTTLAIPAVFLVVVLSGSLAFSADNTETADSAEAGSICFLSVDGEVLPEDHKIDRDTTTYIIVHGFQGRGTHPENLDLAAAIRQHSREANVFIADWRPPAKPDSGQKASWVTRLLLPTIGNCVDKPGEYIRWVSHARQAARDIAQWMKLQGISPSNTVLVGHSLGTQVAAFVSNETAKEEMLGQPVRAILASDPAGPLFQGSQPERRLDCTDASEVIVIHTSAILGDETPIGTVDIYVVQPEAGARSMDFIAWHNYAHTLVKRSFREPSMVNTDGTPFGANALGFDFSDGEPRVFQPERKPELDLASAIATNVPVE